MRYEPKFLIRMGAALALMITPLVGLNIFNFLLKDITLYITYASMKAFGYGIITQGDLIKIGDYTLKFVTACTATSAYYLLSILILLTKDISLKKGIKAFLVGALLILLMNLARIDILLIVLIEKGINMFESLHILFWEVISSLYVVGVWIFLTKKFRIKTIPVLSDMKELYRKAKKKKR